MATIEPDRDAGRPESDGPADGADPVPELVDWGLGIVAGVIGLVVTAVGGWLYTQVDRAAIADVVRSDETTVEGLTTEEAIRAADPFVDWLAAGLVVTGLVLVVGAAVFVYARRRTRRRVAREGGTTATFWGAAVYGAATTMLASFVPFSSVVGGGAAAYLRDADETRVGAAAGLIGTVLLAPLLAFGGIGALAGADAIGELAGGAALVAFVVGVQLLAVAFNVGLSALGGYLAGRFL